MMSDVGNEGRGWYGECPQAARRPILTANEIERRWGRSRMDWARFLDKLFTPAAPATFNRPADFINTALERMEREAEAMKAEEARLA